ncbi:IclR family transcriptional regulator [Rhodococcus sp. BP-149]|uniref:IclR family transcriptional regulator n=1 Tax=unclassified Rhodococcus (in: high G+C Gram-positive bacteria) TaxID=192944 RepID=UPI001C9ABBDB|nr:MULTISPECIES: IclR family transcriptional regulator [unclassified Rhodococcus (in: high G+C Gram-positive bacteria)]MBY6685683.1 IclR family transcriptional regulator [Rhodococcus sp. BP-288]MBY6694769.1 IclR family transcriptional regulator [Rhodococcus sp. BP-188]MBY6696615.1 IclR family transcriptional regulator [Rhodococcus sp. BP-285]MBY6703271.1 IclR family transcriptional regulator [Rhodococcus sp. BP-283]MBY6710775.1 IclR family transcriptional regulator [Rhodococcus sp. BP-160]
MENATRSTDSSVQSVDRAVSILQILGRHGARSVTEIAADLSLHKSTAFRLLATLEARGLVEQATSRGKYQLGYGVVQLATGAARGHDLSVVSRPICQDLAVEVGETVNVAVRDENSVVSIDQVIGSAAVTTINWVGQRTPLHATSAGKVFLAFLPEDERRALLVDDLERFTPHTIVDVGLLEKELDQIRLQGFSVTHEEHEIGLAAVAAPIRVLNGDVVAAVTASGPTFRFDDDSIPGITEHVLTAAAAISERNGHPKQG